MGQKHVLVVDDEPQVLEYLTSALTRSGYLATPCARYEDAKAALAAGRPDLLLTDIRLGAYNGLQLAILATQKYPGTPVIILTGFEDPTLRDEAQRAGATFVVKPLTLEDLLARVKAALASSRSEDPRV
jgi:DNA-binding response OmpR family regulator